MCAPFLYLVNRKYFYFYSKVLADLAIWEPKTFEAIVNTCRQRAVEDRILGINETSTDNKVVKTVTDEH